MATVPSLSRSCSGLNALVVKRGFNSLVCSNVATTTQRRFRSAPKTVEPSALPPVFLLPFQSTFTRSQRTRHCGASTRYQQARYPPSPPSSRAYSTAILNPRLDETGSAMSISISARASSRLAAIASQETLQETSSTPSTSTTPSPTPPSPPNTLLRITVESGGCHGFQYLMSLTSPASISTSDDTIFEATDGTGARVVLDEPSLQLLKGSEVDYTEELIGSHFVVRGNPRAKSSCGCGTSFDVVDA
ncbi:MAG: hypothetical protein M1824_000832 [Vezdaea acicularis]|nr:MAG: hypothetical protein M1824_000832 [Vezdaea acicularis]